MFCPECGERLPDDARFCGFCGFEIPVQPSDAVSPDPEAIHELGPDEPAPPEDQPTLEPGAVSSPQITTRAARRGLPTWGWIVIAVVILVGINVGALLILGGGSDSASPGTSTSSSTPSFSDAVGEWESYDLGDGSYQTMTITLRSGDRYHVEVWDREASACGVDGAGEPLHGATVEGEGVASGTLLTGTGAEVLCLSEPPAFLMLVDLELRYQASSDNIIGHEGVIWSRR